ncbi:MAG: hypothetical protein AB8F34_07175 [Akkermansiaceae bacterium]
MQSDRYKPVEGSEHYSPEEMMARLKKSERHKRQSDSKEDGELVTREDGSQVVKVRRRKRRSKQPEKQKKKTNPKLKWAILGTFIGICVLLAAATVFIIAKYNGSSFKKTTEESISSLSGASQVEITQMRVTPISVKATKTELNWDQHSFLESAVLHHLDADILATSFLGSEWIGEEIVSSQGEVFLKTPSPSEEVNNDPPVSPYKFGSYRCNQLNLHFGKSKGAPTIGGMMVSLWTLPDGRRQIVFNNGRMLMSGWPELEISSGVATLNASDIEVEALLEAGEAHKGELRIKGHIRKDTSKAIGLDVKAKDYPIQELLGKGLGRIIRGDITSEMGSLQYHYEKQLTDALSFVMPFSSSELIMTELPMFNDLKDLTGDTQYVRPTFNDCNGTLKRTSDGVMIDNIDFKSSSVMTLTGRVAVANDGRMTGELVVGLPRRLFDPAKIPQAFNGPRDGIYTVSVTVSGTIHNPYDNLNELLKFGKANQIKPSTSDSSSPKIPRTNPIPRDKEKEFEDLLR